MVTKCVDIITSAYRRSQVGAAGVTLGPTQLSVGLELLRGMYERMARGLLATVSPFYLSSGNYTALENQRIYKASAGSVITLPATVVDDTTGETRAPKDGAVIEVVDPVAKTTTINIYNARYASWQDVSNLTSTDVAPMVYEHEEDLKNILGLIICGENGLKPPPSLSIQAALGKLAIATRPGVTSDPVAHEFF